MFSLFFHVYLFVFLCFFCECPFLFSGAQNLIFGELNFVTISHNILHLEPSRGCFGDTPEVGREGGGGKLKVKGFEGRGLKGERGPKAAAASASLLPIRSTSRTLPKATKPSSA